MGVEHGLAEVVAGLVAVGEGLLGHGGLRAGTSKLIGALYTERQPGTGGLLPLADVADGLAAKPSGWCAWRSGNRAPAGIAAERALTADPGYSATDLLRAALASGVDPHGLPKLRIPRGGHRCH